MSFDSVIARLLNRGAPSTFRDVSRRVESQPLFVDGRPPTVLCIHGFTGVPGEVQVGVDIARARGLRAVAPLLDDHGKDAAALAKTTFRDWVESARPSFDEARALGPVVFVAQSLGCLVATELALSAPGAVLGMALLANAFWLKSPHPGLSLRVAAALGVPDFFVPKEGPDLGDPETYATHVTYDAQPAHAAMELEAAGRRLRGELFRIHRPTLILHGAQDRVCPVQNAWRVAERLGTKDVRVVIYPRSHHILARDVEREQVRQEIDTFVARLLAG